MSDIPNFDRRLDPEEDQRWHRTFRVTRAVYCQECGKSDEPVNQQMCRHCVSPQIEHIGGGHGR